MGTCFKLLLMFKFIKNNMLLTLINLGEGGSSDDDIKDSLLKEVFERPITEI